ncbi:MULTISPECIES: DUF2141 domain-containing protein [Sphingomonadales]|uniref:DUF2141 domain-containing protein n=2 Tax=Edaphosphingomonas TaxID=3423724 RepID=A0A2T4HLG4_9SPHN|nr:MULTISPECIES: DUF2141 domain-containing protein [Sphingomonas]AGH48958.1 hypothetical protein G432_06155 [Sphingomonas sp. MM-1]MDX3884531.1 DUF2141 domain-containing protein [Sphingomonas sp.]OHT21375.1 hypothetical protein BHE75_03382 [Sphingomonas haloaromaticamans]PTD16643.1 DUF2141 domain-containing protein [Sphingomonas fennica]
MLKLSSFATIPALALVVSATMGAGAARAAALGPDAAACAAGATGAAVLVKVDGFKSRTGNLRVQVYGGNEAEFLAKGKKLKRVDLPVSASGPMEVCVALPQPGNYAVAVRHDVDGNGKSSRNDGGGFSRNPGLSIVSLKPKYEDVVISVGARPQPVPVVLNYFQGLSIKPIKSAAR